MFSYEVFIVFWLALMGLGVVTLFILIGGWLGYLLAKEGGAAFAGFLVWAFTTAVWASWVKPALDALP